MISGDLSVNPTRAVSPPFHFEDLRGPSPHRYGEAARTPARTGVELDLLTDKFIVKKSITKQDQSSRAIDSSKAFDAIEGAYRQLKDQLIYAASISPKI